MRLLTSSGVLLATALFAGCARAPAPAPATTPPPDAAAIRAELSVQLEKLMVTLQSKDATGIASMFTEDATWILPDATTSKGRAEIEQTASAFFATYESATVTPPVIDRLVVISDSEALTFSASTYTITMNGGQPETHRNPFADYWKKGADGIWRIAYEVNADGPVGGASNP